MLNKADFQERRKKAEAVIQEQNRQEQNILTSVRRCLTKGEFTEARQLANGNLYQNRDKVEEMFKKFPPKAETCPDCQKIIKPVFYSYGLEWKNPSCLNCSYLAAKARIKDLCSETMERRGIPKRFLDAKLSEFPTEYRQLSKGDSGIFLHGPRGVGKTHFMAAILRNEIFKTEPLKYPEDFGKIEYGDPLESHYPLFLTVPELLLKIRSTFDGHSEETEEAILEKYSNVDVLFLDDLGTEKPTDWAVQTLYLLIDRRYSEMRKTFISSNLSLDEISVRLDDRISSRIAGMCEVIEMKGKDRRLK